MREAPSSIFPDLDGLAIFVAIAERGGLTAASRALGLPKRRP
jgi:DNA-binding transcriptional LysR family regulator